ncbi:MAG: hypothetical protein EB127_12770 [Alphaproteobacteria bacterium]|nr:hypothetical protein [Alphaproteobacteria bacterium]
MGIVKGLKDLNKVMDKPQSNGGEGTKGRWVKLEDAESVKIRFLQELDPDSPTYNEKAGLGFIAVEHTNPKDYRRKGLCTMEDQGKCYGCEQHRKDYKAGWKGRSRLYINVLVDDGKEDPYVAILSQGSSGKTITPTLIEYAGEMGSITNLMWRIKRTGTKTDTSYTIIPLQKDESAFDSSGLELYDLETVAVRDLPYAEQEAFFSGESNNETQSATSSSLDW